MVAGWSLQKTPVDAPAHAHGRSQAAYGLVRPVNRAGVTCIWLRGRKAVARGERGFPGPLGQQPRTGQPAPGPLSPGWVGPGPRCAGGAVRTEQEGSAVPLRGGRRGPGVVLVLRRVGASAAEPGLSRGCFASSQPAANSRRWLGGDGGGRWVITELSAARPFGGAGPTRPWGSCISFIFCSGRT